MNDEAGASAHVTLSVEGGGGGGGGEKEFHHSYRLTDVRDNKIIALKSILRDLLTAPQTVCNTHPQVAPAQSCANHVQHIERLSRTTRVPRGTKGQLSYKV